MFTIILAITLLGSVAMSQIDRSKHPAPGPTPSFKLPKAQHAKLKNGLAIMLVEHHELPVVSMQLVFQSGSANDPLDKPGVASVTFDMMDEGTAKRDALQIAEDLAFLGASMGLNAGVDGSSIMLQTLEEKLNDALEIFSDVLLNPSFPQKEFDRIQKTRLASLLQENDQPAIVATKAFNKVIFGAHHPYGLPANGSPASIKSMTVADLKKFYAEVVLPNNATLIVTGNVTLKELAPILERYLGSWQKGDASTLKINAKDLRAKSGIFLVDKSQAPQSQLRIGHVGVSRDNPDYFSIEVMNTILGGQFTSRINYNLRERRGYTYGARSGFSYRKFAGPFLTSAGVKSSVTDSSVIETLYEIKRIRDEAVTAEELADAKMSMMLRYPTNFETPAQIASQLANIVLYNLGDDYFNKYIDNIKKVTIADVQRVAKMYLSPENLSVVIVGDVATIKEPLEKLNRGKAVILNSEGEVIN